MPPEAAPQPGHDLFWRAWEALRNDRQYTQTGIPLPITFMAIDAYADRNRIDGQMFDTLHTLLRAMDDEWRAFIAEKRAQQEQSRKS